MVIDDNTTPQMRLKLRETYGSANRGTVIDNLRNKTLFINTRPTYTDNYYANELKEAVSSGIRGTRGI